MNVDLLRQQYQERFVELFGTYKAFPCPLPQTLQQEHVKLLLTEAFVASPKGNGVHFLLCSWKHHFFALNRRLEWSWWGPCPWSEELVCEMELINDQEWWLLDLVCLYGQKLCSRSYPQRMKILLQWFTQVEGVNSSTWHWSVQEEQALVWSSRCVWIDETRRMFLKPLFLWYRCTESVIQKAPFPQDGIILTHMHQEYGFGMKHRPQGLFKWKPVPTLDLQCVRVDAQTVGMHRPDLRVKGHIIPQVGVIYECAWHASEQCWYILQ